MENVCISTVEGYSFFFENEDKFVTFKTGKPMSGTDVSKELNISRMAVSQNLKRGLKKVYYILKKFNRHLDSFEIAVTMSQLFNVSVDNDKEMTKFFNLFPKEIKKEIKTNAKDKFRSCSKCNFKVMCELL
jgi:predicted transcriptional regulator